MVQNNSNNKQSSNPNPDTCIKVLNFNDLLKLIRIVMYFIDLKPNETPFRPIIEWYATRYQPINKNQN